LRFLVHLCISISLLPALAQAAYVTSLNKTPLSGVYNEDRIDFTWTIAGAADSIVVDFGDGGSVTLPGDAAGARHYYHDAGRYDVRVTIWENGATNTRLEPNYAVVAQRPLPGSNMMFVHHSTGRNMIRDSGVRSILDSHNVKFGTAIKLWDHDYHSGNTYTGIIRPDSTAFPDWSYGAEANDIQPDGWFTVFCTNSAFRDSLFNRHDVIVLKNDHSTGDIISSTQLAQYLGEYLQIRDVLDQYPDKLFVLMSGPPRRPEEITVAEADRARVFYDWLQSPAYMNGHPNIVFFDLFDALASPNDPADPTRNMLREEYRRPYPVDDSHPNEFANRTIGPQFASLLIRLVDPDWIDLLTGAGEPAPAPFALLGNHPNPFNPATTLTFELARPEVVSLRIYDLSGRVIRSILTPTRLPAGPHALRWDGSDDLGRALSSGVYLYRLEGAGTHSARTMTLVR
jgi:hypothetical protein